MSKSKNVLFLVKRNGKFVVELALGKTFREVPSLAQRNHVPHPPQRIKLGVEFDHDNMQRYSDLSQPCYIKT